MEYLLGKERADKIKESIKDRVASLKRKPQLVVLLNSQDSSSRGYVRSQEKLALSLGYQFTLIEVETPSQYKEILNKLNNDDEVDAILLTRPLVPGSDELAIVSLISPLKDVDGMSAASLGKIVLNDKNALVPATARAIVEMLDAYKIDVCSKNVLIVGRSISVGKPTALLLLNKNANIAVAHTKTLDLDTKLSAADIVVVAVGKPHLIDGSKLKEEAIVIDAGIHYLEDKIIGDVKPSDNLKMISKVPGGVGTLTSACLMDNVLQCYFLRKEKHD